MIKVYGWNCISYVITGYGNFGLPLYKVDEEANSIVPLGLGHEQGRVDNCHIYCGNFAPWSATEMMIAELLGTEPKQGAI